MFLKALGLEANTTYAVIHTRLNGEMLDESTRNEQVGAGHWKLGHEVRKKDDLYVWSTWTVENAKHVPNFSCIVTPQAKLVEGSANCFALGWMPLDQAYIDELLEEMQEAKPGWDKIEGEAQ